jgi:hypothetical protein
LVVILARMDDFVESVFPRRPNETIRLVCDESGTTSDGRLEAQLAADPAVTWQLRHVNDVVDGCAAITPCNTEEEEEEVGHIFLLLGNSSSSDLLDAGNILLLVYVFLLLTVSKVMISSFKDAKGHGSIIFIIVMMVCMVVFLWWWEAKFYSTTRHCGQISKHSNTFTTLTVKFESFFKHEKSKDLLFQR